MTRRTLLRSLAGCAAALLGLRATKAAEPTPKPAIPLPTATTTQGGGRTYWTGTFYTFHLDGTCERREFKPPPCPPAA